MSAPDRQFVIQQHTTPAGIHWDLMLQQDETLWTWRLSIPPVEFIASSIIVEKIANHPLRFLSYEGPVQNNAGSVIISDKGTLFYLLQSEKEICFKATGQILKGTFQLKAQQDCLWQLSRLG